MTSLLRDRPAAGKAMRDIVGDAALLRAALACKAALARAGAARGIAEPALAAILAGCASVTFGVP